MGKTSLKTIATRYLNTLVDNNSGKIMLADIVVQLLFPVISGVAFFMLWPDEISEWPIRPDTLSNLSSGLMTVVSIVSALLCGVAVMIFQLRLQLASQVDPIPEEDETELIDQMFNQVLWDVVAGFVTALLIVCSMAFPEGSTPWRGILAASIAMIINFILVTCMCIKRFSAAYHIISKVWKPKRK